MIVIKRIPAIILLCFLCVIMISCSSTDNTTDGKEESSDNSNSGWKYFDEMGSVPTPDSCIDDVILETSFIEDGNKIYGYFVSDINEGANEKYNQYLELLEEKCGFQFAKKPNIALARENGESLFGVAITETDEGNYIMDVLFFTSDSEESSTDQNAETYPSISSEPSTNQDSTMGEQQALKKALQYLDYTAFSYTGLIKQLEYEGFSHSEAVYGAENCGANWDEQAAKKAQDYLDLTSFSRESLISQLEYEGFTHSQAEYGASAVGY